MGYQNRSHLRRFLRAGEWSHKIGELVRWEYEMVNKTDTWKDWLGNHLWQWGFMCIMKCGVSMGLSGHYKIEMWKCTSNFFLVLSEEVIKSVIIYIFLSYFLFKIFKSVKNLIKNGIINTCILSSNIIGC